MGTIVTGSSTKMVQMMSIDDSWGFLLLIMPAQFVYHTSLYVLVCQLCYSVSRISHACWCQTPAVSLPTRRTEEKEAFHESSVAVSIVNLIDTPSI